MYQRSGKWWVHARAGGPCLLPLGIALGLVVIGGLLVTFLANVPLNDELDAVELTAPPGVLAQAREDYEDPWNAWNTVRALACTAALGCLAWALSRAPSPATAGPSQLAGAS